MEKPERRSVIHLFDPMPHTSPFDINMAVDAGFEVVIPYTDVKLEQVHGLVQDANFSRGPAGVKRTGIFIGGRDIGLAMTMLEATKKAMVPPFQVSVLADPSGAFTTAAALVACVEKQLKAKYNRDLKDCRAVVFGGTGPVGIATGVIVSLCGADTTLVDHLNIENALHVSAEYSRLCECPLRGTFAGSDADKAYLLGDAEVVFCTAKAGIEVLNPRVLADTRTLKVAGDVNAVAASAPIPTAPGEWLACRSGAPQSFSPIPAIPSGGLPTKRSRGVAPAIAQRVPCWAEGGQAVYSPRPRRRRFKPAPILRRCA